jgi:adenosylcobinamide-GDP ribazoletransferase
VAAALTVAAYILLTGGLHLDGLGDTFDGLFSNRPKERRLAIMRDSRVGTNAVLALVSVILCDYSVFAYCFAALGFEKTAPLLLLFPVAGRIGSLVAAGGARYAGDRAGMGKSFIGACGRKEGLLGAPGYVVCVFAGCAPFGVFFSVRPLVFGLCGLAVSVVPILSARLLRHVFEQKIDGLTGDVLGAICELNQTGALLLAVAAIRAAGLYPERELKSELKSERGNGVKTMGETMKLILIRHGQTDSNKRMTYCGQTYPPLNGEGVRQATQSAEHLYALLAGETIAGIYSSPLRRALMSAQIFADRFLVDRARIVVADAIQEMNFGVFEDLTHHEIQDRYPDEHRAWKTRWMEHQIRGGESNRMVFERVGNFFETFIQTHEGGPYLFVMHMCAMVHAISAMLELGIEALWRFHINNAGIVIIEVNAEKFCYLSALNG